MRVSYKVSVAVVLLAAGFLYFAPQVEQGVSSPCQAVVVQEGSSRAAAELFADPIAHMMAARNGGNASFVELRCAVHYWTHYRGMRPSSSNEQPASSRG